ncbi:DUF4376 domain-containing protein [Vibrio cholerae]
MKHWTIDKETREVIGCGDTDKWNMPRNVLLVDPLPPKEGFAVVAKTDLSGTEYVSNYRGKTIYNKVNPLESKQVENLGEIEEGWTLTRPPHQYVIWDEAQTNWQNDIEKRRAAKNAEIKAWRDSQENGSDLIVTVDSIDWNADPAARNHIINAKSSSFQQPFWTDAHNVDQTEFDLQKIFDAFVVRGSEIHQRKREMNEFIEACQTFEEIDEFVVGWNVEE